MSRIITLENVIQPELLRAVAATWPRDDWPHWHRYRDATADKFGTKDADRLPPAAKLVIAELASLPVEKLLGVGPCFPDMDLHGSGMHMLNPGGFLACHLDGAVHPLTSWARICNAVLFVDDWVPEFGGSLQMVNSETRQPSESVLPSRGRVALFVTAGDAWHQVAEVTGPVPRRTLSVFWWSTAASTETRNRAEFRGDQS